MKYLHSQYFSPLSFRSVWSSSLSILALVMADKFAWSSSFRYLTAHANKVSLQFVSNGTPSGKPYWLCRYIFRRTARVTMFHYAISDEASTTRHPLSLPLKKITSPNSVPNLSSILIGQVVEPWELKWVDSRWLPVEVQDQYPGLTHTGPSHTSHTIYQSQTPSNFLKKTFHQSTFDLWYIACWISRFW